MGLAKNHSPNHGKFRGPLCEPKDRNLAKDLPKNRKRTCIKKHGKNTPRRRGRGTGAHSCAWPLACSTVVPRGVQSCPLPCFFLLAPWASLDLCSTFGSSPKPNLTIFIWIRHDTNEKNGSNKDSNEVQKRCNKE